MKLLFMRMRIDWVGGHFVMYDYEGTVLNKMGTKYNMCILLDIQNRPC